MGRNIDNEKEFGDVVIKDNGHVDILNHHGVTLFAGFRCEKGGTLKIHN